MSNRILSAFAPALLALAGTMAIAPAAHATVETPEAKADAAIAAHGSLDDLESTFGTRAIEAGKFHWAEGRDKATRVVVNLTDQIVFVYDDEGLIAASSISSGRDSHPTPTGLFPIMEKKRHHRSNQYNDAPMPFMQRLDNYGIAFHAGDLPGYRASHGCIRLPTKFAAKLFAATEVGTPVLVGRYEVVTT